MQNLDLKSKFSSKLKLYQTQQVPTPLLGVHLQRVIEIKQEPRKNKSSRSQMFFKISALKNFANLTVKHLCWSLFFNKVAALKA